MKSFLATAAVTLALASGALAQAPYGPGGGGAAPGGRYLGLLNRGANPAVNYYGIVRPQQQLAGAVGQLQQQQINNNQPDLDPTEQTGPGITGHTSYFNNLSHYYNNNPVAGGGGRGGAGLGAGGAGGFGMQGGGGRRAPAAPAAQGGARR